MTQEVLNYLKQVRERIGKKYSILEVGSLNINGSAREVFQEPGVSYTGIDQQSGPGVDRVGNAHRLFSIPDVRPFQFDLVICCETLEHDPRFWITVDHMKAALNKGGWLVVTTPGITLEKHDYPQDYYRFFGETYHEVIFDGLVDVEVQEYYLPGNLDIDKRPNWVFGMGRKP